MLNDDVAAELVTIQPVVIEFMEKLEHLNPETIKQILWYLSDNLKAKKEKSATEPVEERGV